MNHSTIAVVVLFVMCSTISTSNGQLDAIKNVGSAADCIQKLPQCSGNKPNEQERDQKKAYCCSAAAWVRCVNQLIESTCPGTAASQVMGMAEPGSGGYCDSYTFWTPECLYTNYMIVVIGSAAGLAVLLLIIVIAVCCCCCRSKK